MPVEGWYPHPDGKPGKVRWWDGRAWTDEILAIPIIDVEPAPAVEDSAVPEVDGSAVVDEPEPVLAVVDEPEPVLAVVEEPEPEAAVDGPEPEAAVDGPEPEAAVVVDEPEPVAASDGEVAVVGYYLAAARPTPVTSAPALAVQGPRTRLLTLAIVGGAVLLLGLGVLFGVIGPSDGLAALARPMVSHQEALGVDDEAWETELTLGETTTVTIDVRSEDFDAVVHLIRDGDEIAWNDDRGDRAAREHGGGLRDPLLEIRLPADTYTVRVTALGDGTGDFEVTISR